MSHLKRSMMPKTWPINRKGKIYTIAPARGPHPKSNCLPLQIIVRDVLKYAATGDEARRIIKRGAVSVDGVVRKDHRYPAGFMDIVSIKETGENFRVTLGPKGIYLEKSDDSVKKLCIIRKKYTAQGGIQCIALHDGRVLQLGKDKNTYKPGETVAIEVPGQKIVGHFGFEKGADAVIINGSNRGARGKIKEVRDRKFMTEKSTVIVDSDGREIETIKSYVMITGTKKGGKK